MDKNTFSHYGWIVVVVIIICILMSTINPFLSLIKVQLGSTFDALDNATAGALDKIVVGGFGGKGNGRIGGDADKLPKPILSIEDGLLIITASSSDVEYYAITVNGSDVGSVSAVMPDTEYDLSGLADETHVIGVIAKAAGKEDSDRATITYTKKSKLASPVVTVEDDKLIIDGPDDTEEYEITIDGVVVGTVPAEHPTTEYELPEFDAGKHTIDVVAKADDKEDSDKATVVCEKLSKPVISAADNTLTITGPEGAKYYEIFIDGTSVGGITATSPSTKYDLSNLALGDYEISVVAKADGKYDSDPATTTYKQRILAIGKTVPSYVLATYSDDYSSVTITKNGEESDGLMKDFTDASNIVRNNLATVNVNEGVKNIGKYAFNNCQTLTHVTLPDGLTELGVCSFRRCKNLPTISIPTSVTIIENDAFADSSIVTGITLHEGITKIGSRAFYGCDAMESFTVPSTVTSFGTNVFKYCEALKSVTFNNVMTSIPDGTFAYCFALENFTIPSTVKSIDRCAFEFNYNLKTVTIPEGVTAIGERAFYSCEKLDTITIPSTVSSIGVSAFEKCIVMPNINIPYGVTKVENRAFAGCWAATSISIPDTVTSIDESAFFYCKSVTSINIPASVTSIGFEAFRDCHNLFTYNFEAATAPEGFEDSAYAETAVFNFNVAM